MAEAAKFMCACSPSAAAAPKRKTWATCEGKGHRVTFAEGEPPAACECGSKLRGAR